MARLLERGRRRHAPAPVAPQWTHRKPTASEPSDPARRMAQRWIPFAADRVHLPRVRAQILDRARASLTLREIEDPRCGDGQVRVSVSACAVCRTDLHVLDGE